MNSDNDDNEKDNGKDNEDDNKHNDENNDEDDDNDDQGLGVDTNKANDLSDEDDVIDNINNDVCIALSPTSVTSERTAREVRLTGSRRALF